MLESFILLAAVQFGGEWPDPKDMVTPQVAAARLRACGLRAVPIRSSGEMDADVIFVAKVDRASGQQLACADRAAGIYYVKFAPSLQPRFDALRKARLSAATIARGRAWLRAHHLLGRVPVYRQGVTDDAAFARKIETLCGAENALQSRYGPHALNLDWGRGHLMTAKGVSPAFECLMNVGWATGYMIDFIGNGEALPATAVNRAR